MRVLVVEDNPRTAEVLGRGLREEHWVVDVVNTGREGLRLGRMLPYDVIVLDIRLPDVDGHQVCRQLREWGVWTPVLMLTALGGVSDRAAGLDEGADDYVVKPFTFVELTARVRALARRGAVPRPTVLSVGDLVLDPAANLAERAGVALDLSAKEFALLELFMRHPGDVLSRTFIREKVWDFAYDGDSNVVDQYVGYLRRKIDRPFGRHDLETVRGRGYRLLSAGVV